MQAQATLLFPHRELIQANAPSDENKTSVRIKLLQALML
jgi:hypothetical protein